MSCETLLMVADSERSADMLYAVGMIVPTKVGHKIAAGQPLGRVLARTAADLEHVRGPGGERAAQPGQGLVVARASGQPAPFAGRGPGIVGGQDQGLAGPAPGCGPEYQRKTGRLLWESC